MGKIRQFHQVSKPQERNLDLDDSPVAERRATVSELVERDAGSQFRGHYREKVRRGAITNRRQHEGFEAHLAGLDRSLRASKRNLNRLFQGEDPSTFSPEALETAAQFLATKSWRACEIVERKGKQFLRLFIENEGFKEAPAEMIEPILKALMRAETNRAFLESALGVKPQAKASSDVNRRLLTKTLMEQRPIIASSLDREP